jgi:predicted PurR-regulated permease PerM
MLPRALTTLGVVPEESPDSSTSQLVRWPPRWIVAVVFVFWLGWLGSGVAVDVWHRISGLVLLLVISLFLALAIEPGVNRLGRHGWGRGRATATIMFGVIIAIGVFIGAMGTLIGTQIADLLSNSETYISDTVDTINDWFGTEIDAEQVIADFNDPNGSVQQFIDSQQDDAIRLSGQVLNGLLAAFSVLLFSYYLVADGPRLRRSICSRLSPDRQARVLSAWELAINKTGGYLYSRLLLSLMSAVFHWAVFAAAGVRSPVALALWVGLVSQFLPVIGTYIAGVLPVLITFLDSPVRALIVLGVIAVYQQLENYLISPKVTARTMELHPAIAFGAALAGLALLGPAGAVLALPTAAMAQALISEWGARHDVIDSPLTAVSEPRPVVRRVRRRGGGVA